MEFLFLQSQICSFIRPLLKPGPGPWKTWTLKNMDAEKYGINMATSKTWTQTLDLDPGPGPRKSWTLKNLDLEKAGP